MHEETTIFTQANHLKFIRYFTPYGKWGLRKWGMWKMTKKGLLVKVYIHSLAKWMFKKIFNKNSTLKQNYFVFFHCAICSQLLLLCIFEFISMNSFLNDSINIYLYKRLQCNVYGQLLFTFSLYLISLKNKRFIKFIKYDDSTA